jgi:hypothetical protein
LSTATDTNPNADPDEIIPATPTTPNPDFEQFIRSNTRTDVQKVLNAFSQTVNLAIESVE